MATSIAPNRNKYPPVDLAYAEALGLNKEEWERILEGLGREPTEYECKIFSILWSEECSNKSTAKLTDTIYRDGYHVMRIKGRRCGLIDIGHDEVVSVYFQHTNESADIEAGLAVRSSLAQVYQQVAITGTQPLAFLNLLRLGPLEKSESQKSLVNTAKGLSEYSSRVGVPVVGGELAFHPRYEGDVFLSTACIGFGKKDDTLLPKQATKDSPILYVGQKTNVFTLDGEEVPLTVSNPVFSAEFKRLLSEMIDEGLILGVERLDAGGLAEGLFRLALRVECGVRCDLDRVPNRFEEPKPDLLFSSQGVDRFVIVPAEKKHRALSDKLVEAGFSVNQIGQLTDTNDISLLWRHNPLAVIPYEFALGETVEKTFELVKFPPMLKKKKDEQEEPVRKKKKGAEGAAYKSDLGDTWIDLLANANLCSRKPFVKTFDQNMGSRTLSKFCSDASVLRLISDDDSRPERGLAVSIDSAAAYGVIDPYLAAVHSVAEGVRNLAAVGATSVGIAQCLNYGNPEEHREISELSEAIRGISDTCRFWDIPILSDSISLNNGTKGSPVLGTPVVVSIGLVSDVNKTIGPAFSKKGDAILVLGEAKDEFGGSQYYRYILNSDAGQVPDINFSTEQKTSELVAELVFQGLIESAHDISQGGLAQCLAECSLSMSQPTGFSVKMEELKGVSPEGILFGESASRFVISCSEDKLEAVKKLCSEFGVKISGSGKVGGKNLDLSGAASCSVPLKTAIRIWNSGLEHVLGSA